MWIGVQIKGDPTKNQKKLKSKEGDRGLLFGTEEYKSQSFYKDKGKCWGNYQINDLVVFNDFKGSDYQLPQRLKLPDCFPYVIESRGVYEIY